MLQARTEALDEARRAAQEANAAKGRYVNMISHELRTPLGAIGGYATLLDEGIQGPLSEGQREYIARILYNQRHLLRLVDELLDLAKIESGQFPLRLAAVPVQEVLASVQTMIEPQIRDSGLNLEVRPCDHALFLHGDGERVEQIVLNLLSNAVKFTPRGGVVKIVARARDDVIELEVADTGAGIPQDKLESVFAPFFQIDQPGGRSRTGTGLGLSISRELARAMNGDLKAESVPGEGSTFTLSLPRTSAAPAPPG